jgi:predicted lipoprotein with Yx(FWY)xxD motif
MRKSGFAAAAGIGSLALLLTACGGSSSSTSTTSTSTPASTSTGAPAATSSSGALGVQPGSTVLHVQKAGRLGYVLATGNGQVVYMYDKDKGGTPACTGTCAQTWIPVAGKKPAASPADIGLGAFTTVANGSITQIVYDGHPLYIYKGAKALAATGNGVGGEWHVIKLSASNIVSS